MTEQLRDRDWFYRRSGLFGKSDDQRGSIPVALVLQVLDLILHERLVCYSTSLDLKERSPEGIRCEADFVVVARQLQSERPAVIIGECKSQNQISKDDALNLSAVADRLASVDVDPFVLFAKTSEFSPDEVELCKLAQPVYSEQVILLNVADLEAPTLAERRDNLPDRARFAFDAKQLAERTTQLYFGGAYRTGEGWSVL